MKVERFDFVEDPILPRKQKTPNYKTLEQYFVVDGLPLGAEAPYPSNPKEHIVKCILKFWIPSLLPSRIDLTRKAFRLTDRITTFENTRWTLRQKRN